MGDQAESIYRLLLRETNSGATIRLRHTLAKEGCKESQITLAKYLLTVGSNCPEEREFNAQSAIYWLLQAVKTGQEEAFLLLEECLKTGLGINALNYTQIKKCLEFTKEEKLARKIAFSLNTMSDTEEPTDIFGDKIELIFQRNDETLGQTKIEESSECLSFNEVVSSVKNCLEGNVPLVTLKQHHSLTKYADLIMKSLENLVLNLSSLQLSISIMLMILLFVITHLLLPGDMQEMFNGLKSSFCLVTMLSCTCFVININFGGDNLKRWLHLIKYFEPNIRSEDIKRKYFSKTTYPLIIFFFATFFNIASYTATFIDIGFLSVFLMILVDRTIDQKRYYVNISLLINILACFYKANIIQNLFNNFSFFQFDYKIINNLYIHISFISCLALPFVLPYLYFKMGKGSWQLVLLPHLMSLSWMNLACIHLSSTTSSQQMLSLISWLFILLLSNYTSFLFTVLLYSLVIILRTQDYFKIEFFIFSLVFVVIYFFSLTIIKKLKFSHESKIWSFIVCFFILASSFHFSKSTNADSIDVAAIPWEKYQSYCHHSAWYKTNPAEVQITCLPLTGRYVALEGTVTFIDLIQVHNTLHNVANMLPEPFYSWFVCHLGEKVCDSSEIQSEHCKMYKYLNITQCHLHNLDIYVYQITIEISSRTSPEVFVIAEHVCTSFVKTLKEGDTLEVIGKLDVGGTKPVLTLKKSRCTSCYTNQECNISSMQPMSLQSTFSWPNVVWFYLAPFIRYNSNVA